MTINAETPRLQPGRFGEPERLEVFDDISVWEEAPSGNGRGRAPEELGHPLDRVTCDQTSGCWIWLGRLDPNGYGKFGKRYAHRIYYTLFKGDIPEGLTIDHLCRVRNCVNPEHLEAVTLRVNILRSDNPAARNARKSHCVNGHEFSEENTYLYKRGRLCRECGRAADRAAYRRRRDAAKAVSA